MHEVLPVDSDSSGSSDSITKRRASEPYVILWEDGEPFKLSEAYVRTFYAGKTNLDKHPFWTYNKELVGDTLTMQLRGNAVNDKTLTLRLSLAHIAVSCGCARPVAGLCKHACSALMYKVKSNDKFFEQFYRPEMVALPEEQQRLFAFDLPSYYRSHKVPFEKHPEHGRVFGYTNGDSHNGEKFGNTIQLAERVTPPEREAKLVFGIPVGSYHFQLPVLLPYLTKTGTRTSKTNPYSAFEKSYLLTNEDEPESLNIPEQFAETACRNMLRIVEKTTPQTKQYLFDYWAELIPNLPDSIDLLFFSTRYHAFPVSVKPATGPRIFPKLTVASVQLVFDLTEEASSFRLKLSLIVNGTLMPNPRFLGDYYSCFIKEHDDSVLFLADVQDEEIIHQFRKAGFVITVLSQDFDTFFRDILLPLSERYTINLHTAAHRSMFKSRSLEKHSQRLKVEERDDRVYFYPSTYYPVGFEVNPLQEANLIFRKRGEQYHVLHRDKVAEEKFHEMLRELHPSFKAAQDETYFVLPASEIQNSTWLRESLERLRSEGTEISLVNLTEGTDYYPHLLSWELTFTEEKGSYYRGDLSARMGTVPIALDELKDMLRRKKNWFKLKDGTFGYVYDKDKTRLMPLLALGKEGIKQLEIPTSHFNTIANYTEHITNVAIKKGIEIKRRKLTELDTVQPVEQPHTVQATLRHYQEAGLSWLAFLREFGWGGILADDMGLGKTLQVISALEYHYQQEPNSAASLVVVPNTLLFNWQAEFAKFAPQRKIHVHHGLERHKSVKHDDGLVVLTTYGTVMADIDLLTSFAFSYLILDESQAVKNRTSKRFEAASQLNARYRIAMTGTPIENGIADLYAQLSLVNPGFFGTFSDFKRAYPGIADGSATPDTKEELQRAINPFILRRTKKQVAKELPDKSEMLLYCEMLPEQRNVYDEYRTFFKSKLSGSLEEGNGGRSKFIAIEGLMKLRQICNSPALLNDRVYPNSSTKIDEILDHVVDVQGQHKVLIFSAFTAMLSLLKYRLEDAGIEYAYLDGKTSGDERQEQVLHFQEKEQCRVFLLSLKAGGTGLNLTAADYVYILDPWWNPAAEAQAIDRCYRIGQDKHVMAYRMICKDSIEEKILDMQANKRELADSLIQTDGNVLKALNKTELLKLFD
ncbi:DEAD/DEAH box helicase [Parapedobacter sp. 2B3]|uniref:DEAD/DEAH box helicase n=1 Tax=Parapedobacter sp. 2B3 TaxID=3342381 RepID=UPI0035B68199